MLYAARTLRAVLHKAGWALLLIGSLASLPAHAALIPFQDSELYYQFDEEPLGNFFEGFFAEQGLNVILSDGVRALRGTLNGPRSGSPRDLFLSIANTNQILWYYDGNSVFLFQPQERVNRYFNVSRGQASAFARTYRNLNLGNAHNTAQVSNGLVSASGASGFVDQIGQLVGAVAQDRPAPLNTTVKLFSLNYAFAADTVITVGRNQMVVPGIASLLRSAVSGSAASMAYTQTSQLRPASNRLRGQGLASNRPQGRYGNLAPPGYPGSNVVGGYATEAPIPPPYDPNGPHIVADPMHNSILVRDEPKRMAMYEDLISVLDVEPKLVEIEATIIDIDKDRLKKLGFDFRIRTSDTSLEFGDNTIGPDLIDSEVSDNVDLIPALAGLSAGTVVGNSTRFAARLNALHDENLVTVLSSPQVVTLSDMEAVIESSREVFVPVGGTYEVDLFDVIAGTVLRVTPHVIEAPDGNRIRLVTTIEDGDVQLVSSSVQRIEFPVVDRNSVTTQAIIHDGQSLLLGGLNRRAQFNIKNEVPGLRKIPVLKHIFSNVQKQNESTVRLFLLTPRLITPARAAEREREVLEYQNQVEELLENG